MAYKPLYKTKIPVTVNYIGESGSVFLVNDNNQTVHIHRSSSDFMVGDKVILEVTLQHAPKMVKVKDLPECKFNSIKYPCARAITFRSKTKEPLAYLVYTDVHKLHEVLGPEDEVEVWDA